MRVVAMSRIFGPEEDSVQPISVGILMQESAHEIRTCMVCAVPAADGHPDTTRRKGHPDSQPGSASAHALG